MQGAGRNVLLNNARILLRFFFLLVGFSAVGAASVPLQCGDKKYYDQAMHKCDSCDLLCRYETLHTECPVLCPVFYKNLQEKEKTSSSPAPSKTSTPGNSGAEEEPGFKDDDVVNQDDGLDAGDTWSSESQGQSLGLHTVLIFAFLCVGVVGVVIGGVFIWQRKKPQATRTGAGRRSPIYRPTPRSSGNTSLTGSRDLGETDTFLPGVGGSLPALDGQQDATIPKRLQFTSNNGRPASFGDIPRVHFNSGTGVITLFGNPISQPVDQAANTTGSPLTQARKYRSEGDALYQEMRVTSV